MLNCQKPLEIKEPEVLDPAPFIEELYSVQYIEGLKWEDKAYKVKKKFRDRLGYLYPRHGNLYDFEASWLLRADFDGLSYFVKHNRFLVSLLISLPVLMAESI